MYAAVASRAPEFGGLWFDETGQLVIAVTDLSRTSDVRSALRTVNADGIIDGVNEADAANRVRFTEVAHRFLDLHAWRDSAYRARVEGMTLLDVDEVSNRVFVGVDDGSSVDRVRARLIQAQIPEAALDVQVVGRPRRHATLSDRIRPIPAGMKITFSSGGPFAECSLGANASSDLGPGFITASHCTPNWGQVDGGTFFQPVVDFPNIAGTEAVDPPLAPTGQNCSAPDGCRLSDASFIDGATDLEHGKIARPVTFNGGLFSKFISDSKPRFVITDAPLTVLPVGATVYKVGHGGGGETGTVRASCADVIGWFRTPDDPITADLLCQWKITFNGSPGDSGGPVFSWDGTTDNVTFRGIYLGVDTTGIFSPWRSIVLEMSDGLPCLEIVVGSSC